MTSKRTGIGVLPVERDIKYDNVVYLYSGASYFEDPIQHPHGVEDNDVVEEDESKNITEDKTIPIDETDTENETIKEGSNATDYVIITDPPATEDNVALKVVKDDTKTNNRTADVKQTVIDKSMADKSAVKNTLIDNGVRTGIGVPPTKESLGPPQYQTPFP